MEAWTGCMAGALQEDTYRALLAEAGSGDVRIEISRSYSAAGVRDDACCCSPAGGVSDALAPGDGLFARAFIRASKPSA